MKKTVWMILTVLMCTVWLAGCAAGFLRTGCSTDGGGLPSRGVKAIADRPGP